MKEITLSTRRQKIELWILLGSFVIANLLNLWAIKSYNASMSEMATSFFYVLTFTVVLYALTVIVRLAIYGIARLVKLIKK